jgi:hypothetical protein
MSFINKVQAERPRPLDATPPLTGSQSGRFGLSRWNRTTGHAYHFSRRCRDQEGWPPVRAMSYQPPRSLLKISSRDYIAKPRRCIYKLRALSLEPGRICMIMFYSQIALACPKPDAFFAL